MKTYHELFIARNEQDTPERALLRECLAAFNQVKGFTYSYDSRERHRSYDLASRIEKRLLADS